MTINYTTEQKNQILIENIKNRISHGTITHIYPTFEQSIKKIIIFEQFKQQHELHKYGRQLSNEEKKILEEKRELRELQKTFKISIKPNKTDRIFEEHSYFKSN